ncbi:protein of unknown function [Cupriavidus sp. YR651]|uniref:DUF4397 domain-containing protein n=1 Tax=Cupriavidus sp. YR651 TaxID=1855315 RepID=UPI000880275D|nr:DUF4397 domain-containing protein [Cupriavidus sp. YR651]SDC85698.1 protein of unknown function [Cupriavidus sp. YR651]
MRRLIGLLLSVLLIAQLGSCVADVNDDSTARVRVLHVSPDAPNLDVLVDGARVLSNVPYSAASAYLIFSTGTHRIAFNVTGTSTTLIDVSLKLVNATAYTIIAANFAASMQGLTVTDQTQAPPAGQAAVRVIHTAPDAGPVDVLFNGQVVFAKMLFGANSGYLNLAAGTYDVKVNIAGTSTTVIQTRLTANGATNYSVVAIGSNRTAATNPLALKVLTDG